MSAGNHILIESTLKVVDTVGLCCCQMFPCSDFKTPLSHSNMLYKDKDLSQHGRFNIV